MTTRQERMLSQDAALHARNLMISMMRLRNAGLYVDVSFGMNSGIIDVMRNPDDSVVVLKERAEKVWSEVL